MNARPVITYSLLRLAFFLAPLGIMMLFPAFWDMWWLAVLFACLIGVSLSIIFLQKPRAEFSEGLSERRQAKSAREVDEDIENEANARLSDEAPREEDSVDR